LVASCSALDDLLPSPSQGRQKHRVALARIPIQVVVIERNDEGDRVTVPHQDHLLLFCGLDNSSQDVFSFQFNVFTGIAPLASAP
jgi:hypothetical protein